MQFDLTPAQKSYLAKQPISKRKEEGKGKREKERERKGKGNPKKIFHARLSEPCMMVTYDMSGDDHDDDDDGGSDHDSDMV